MDNPVPTADQTALASLQKELASRRSVLHFAHFAVALILSLIAAGTTAKLLWDLHLNPATEIFVIPVATFSGVSLVYSVARYFLGQRELKKELISFARLKALRRELNLEDPSALLP